MKLPKALPESSRQRALIISTLEKLPQDDRAKIAQWSQDLMIISQSNLTLRQKSARALDVTRRSGISKSTFNLLLRVSKKTGSGAKAFWNGSSKPMKAFMATGAATAAVFGGQGAGIAALGTAIGLPLWLVTGAGAMFLTTLLEEAKREEDGADITYFVPKDDTGD